MFFSQLKAFYGETRFRPKLSLARKQKRMGCS